MNDPGSSFGRRLQPPDGPHGLPARRGFNSSLIGGVLGIAVGLILVVMRLTGAPHAATPHTSPTVADLTVVPPDLTPLRAYPNTTITYYDVPGTNTRDIVEYMHTHGIADGHDHTIGEGATTWHMDWHFPVSAAGCNTSEVQVTFRADVTLPRFVDFDRMDQAHQAGWDRYLNAMIVHEAGHIGYAYQHVDDVAAAMRGRSCADANTAAQAAVDTLGQHDAIYDQDTHHGANQGVRYPD